ncbi:hypothetical protein MTR_5g092460 [Medicago truncatula]|uniref:Uncharacterized protein n=1 Tax=Medicago truncatula TaxID=3880 RepID=G7K8H5_MEDTR|nr:hypothetical protein MTR_5g092460 [Medicago truncatula]
MAAHEDRVGKKCENVQRWRSALSEKKLNFYYKNMLNLPFEEYLIDPLTMIKTN